MRAILISLAIFLLGLMAFDKMEYDFYANEDSTLTDGGGHIVVQD